MKFGIVGSRDFAARSVVEQYIDALPEGSTIISGGARGVDSWAAARAKARGLAVVEYIPDWDKHGKAAGVLRNTDIVNAADVVVAFWDGQSRGTLDSINKARKAGKFSCWYNASGEAHAG